MSETGMTMGGIAMYVICWLLLAAIFLVVEIVTLGLTSIWFSGGSFVAAIAAACGASFTVQIILFAAVSFGLLIITRPLAVKHLNDKTDKTNVEALVGESAMVIVEINNMQEVGQVKVNGMEWTARAEQDKDVIPAGTLVTIVAIRGVKLIVKPTEEEVVIETV